MRLSLENSDEAILQELGRRLAQTRLERNVSQERLAQEAGVSKSTVERTEAGQPVKLTSFIRILRATGQLELLDRLIPEPLPSPVERLRTHGRRRQRAATSRDVGQGKAGPWRWADEPPSDPGQ